MDDHALLRAYLCERSQAAFAQLVGDYLPLVHAAALRRMNGDEQRAREVTQLVFSELAQKAARLARHPALAAWLHQCTRWHAAHLRRAEQRRTRHESAAAQQGALLGAGETDPSWESLRPVLDAALDSLRAPDRDAVLQRYFMDRPFAAIGRHLGVTENAARMRVDRALETLRQALIRHGVTSSAAALALVLVQQARAAVPGALTADGVASTACGAATAGTIAATGATMLMTKFASGLVAACAVALSVLLWRQQETNEQFERELATRRNPPTVVPLPLAPSRAGPNPPAAALPSQSLQDIEDEILAAAEFAVPLTAEQQERVRLDTIIRKGELDVPYAMLFRQLNLPPPALDALKTLLVERHQASYDARQLAQEEGLVFASAAEGKAVANSALGAIDARIAALIGGDGYAKLREHVDLGFFRGLAEVARKNASSRTDPMDDACVRDLAHQLHQVAPEYEERVFQSNGWSVDEPPVVRATIAAHVGDVPGPAMAAENSSLQIQRRMQEIARDALLEGSITMDQLSGSVAREYQAARERRGRTSTP